MAVGDPRHADPARMDLIELTKETLATTGRLVEAQGALLRAELEDLARDLEQRALSFGIGVGLASTTMAMVLVTLGLVIARAMGVQPSWVIGVIALVCAMATGVCFAIALRRKHKRVLGESRRVLKEEIKWAKHNLPDPTP